MAKDERKPFDGVGSVAEMMQYLEPEHRERLLKALAEKDPRKAQQIRDRTFTFEDVFSLDDRELQWVLGKIPKEELTKALRGASEEIWIALKRNLPEKAALRLQEEVEALGPRKKSEVEELRRRLALQVADWIRGGLK